MEKKTITSNTLVMNGMPFIGKVLKRVAPYMDEMVICISESSNDGTEEEIKKELKDYWNKVIWMTENVKSPGELTEIENDMVKKSKGDWILFLSDDDYWPQDQLEKCIDLLEDPEILTYSVSPYQLIDWEHYDSSWGNKSFSKFLKNDNLSFVKPWPRELPVDKDKNPLYWRTHIKVKRLPFPEYHFYHLSYMKNWSFRNDDWSINFRHKIGQSIKLEKPLKIC